MGKDKRECCEECGLDVMRREIAGGGEVVLDAYRKPITGLAYSIRSDLKVVPTGLEPYGYHVHEETCPASFENDDEGEMVNGGYPDIVCFGARCRYPGNAEGYLYGGFGNLDDAERRVQSEMDGSDAGSMCYIVAYGYEEGEMVEYGQVSDRCVTGVGETLRERVTVKVSGDIDGEMIEVSGSGKTSLEALRRAVEYGKDHGVLRW